jgi:3-isopropylmalate/(R)-2-methylmalate dehydratase small subunit
METFSTLVGKAAPLMRINIDTDQIIPTRFLLRTTEEGLNEGLFADWRFGPDGAPIAEFVLNQDRFRDAQILLADRNFGCGSSREAAPRALRQSGFRCVIAPSFGDIFYNNCFRNGLLPVRLELEHVLHLAALINASAADVLFEVDLSQQVVRAGRVAYSFSTPEGLRAMLLLGQDEIDQTLASGSAIESFRQQDRQKRPWAYAPHPAA